MITVAKDGTGDFTSVNEAIKSIPDGNETIFIKKGIYKERVEITVDNITLIGENNKETVITEGFYALMPMPDGSRRGTFRSYTFLVHADNFSAYNITFENSSGFGKDVGQAIAVYAEGDHIIFKNCRMLGHQDTLFTGPLKKNNPAALQDQRNSVKESPDASYMKIAIYVEKLTLYLEVLRLILRIVNYMPLTEMKRLTLSIQHLPHMRAKSSDMYLNIVISQEIALTEL